MPWNCCSWRASKISEFRWWSTSWPTMDQGVTKKFMTYTDTPSLIHQLWKYLFLKGSGSSLWSARLWLRSSALDYLKSAVEAILELKWLESRKSLKCHGASQYELVPDIDLNSHRFGIWLLSWLILVPQTQGTKILYLRGHCGHWKDVHRDRGTCKMAQTPQSQGFLFTSKILWILLLNATSSRCFVMFHSFSCHVWVCEHSFQRIVLHFGLRHRWFNSVW